MAKRAHTTQATISRIETGEVKERPDRHLAKRIAKVLEVNFAEVFDDGAEAEHPSPNEGPASGAVFDADAFEMAVLAVVDPAIHMIVDLRAAVEAFGEATRTSGVVRDPATVAPVWLEAARALRVEGIPATPAAVVARVAMRESA